jgi:predicted glycogen debranching enzyme
MGSGTRIDDRTEWLEADGLGGFASGTSSGIRTRRYHALLLTAVTPPTGRLVLVNGFDGWVNTGSGDLPLSTQRYAPDVLHPDGARHIASFTREPWPTWTFDLPDGSQLTQELCVEHGTGTVVVRWNRTGGTAPASLRVRPFMSGRDYHATHHQNPVFRFEPQANGQSLTFQPYDGVPAVTFSSDGDYSHAPDWYRQFAYQDERERGLDDVEDLASPGELRWELTSTLPSAVWILRAGTIDRPDAARDREDVRALAEAILQSEQARRAAFPSDLDRSADA